MDGDRTADGIGLVTLVASDRDRAKIVLKGYGAGLSVASPPLDVPLTAQLRNTDTDVCWSVAYDGTDVTRNRIGQADGAVDGAL